MKRENAQPFNRESGNALSRWFRQSSFIVKCSVKFLIAWRRFEADYLKIWLERAKKIVEISQRNPNWRHNELPIIVARLHQNRFLRSKYKKNRNFVVFLFLDKMLHWRRNGKKFLHGEREGGSWKTTFCSTKGRKMSRIQRELEIAFFPLRSHTHDNNRRFPFHTFTMLKWILFLIHTSNKYKVHETRYFSLRRLSP